jgi:Carbohydrate phosphorylase
VSASAAFLRGFNGSLLDGEFQPHYRCCPFSRRSAYTDQNYKRQHLSVLHIVTLYYRLKQNPGL